MSVCADDERDARSPSPECDAIIADAKAVGRALAGLPAAVTVTRASDLFSALADPTRLRILQALSAEELCVCDLSTVAAVSQSAVSHQLRLLRDRNLVVYRREGKRAVYSLADDHVRVLLAQGLEHVSEGR